MKQLAPNTLLQNRYLVVHLIGKGGMGEVYLAVDQRLGSAVALKRTFFAEDEILGNAFEREARILGRLRHPVLPKVSDHFIEQENQYLVMEHISGDDLAKRLELTQKAFPLSWVLFWADQLLDALSYLHSHEPPIIHRDIKPQNLKLTDENNIILLDFGLSKSSIGDSRLSNPVSAEASGSVIGYTPHYAPMEQIRGTGTSPRSDLYSLSATIYQLLTNIIPPDALSRADSLLNGSPDPVQPISELNAEVGKPVSDVIIKGMAVSHDLRYKNAREMQKELRDAYAQLQKAMSAQTIAFTAPEAVMPQTSEKSVPIVSVPPPVETSQADTVSDAFPAVIPPVETNSYASQPQNQTPNFDATLQYDGEVQAFPSKQSDIKTEVFSGGFSLPQNETFTPQAESFSPEATTPLISFDTQSGASERNSSPQENKAADAMPATAMFVPGGQYAAENFSAPTNFTSPHSAQPEATQFAGEQYRQEDYISQPQPMQAAAVAAGASSATTAQPQQKSGGKGVLIAGVLGLLLFLGIGAAGFGYWYVYGFGSTTKTENDASPIPTPAASVSPTATPTETLVDSGSNTNVNTDSGNSNTSIEETANTNTETNSETVTTTTPVVTKTQTQATVQPTRVNPTPKKTEVSTAGTPKVQPTVKKTPRKGDDTIILQ